MHGISVRVRHICADFSKFLAVLPRDPDMQNPQRVLISQTISTQRNITIATDEGSVELRRGEIRFRQSWHHRSFNTRFVTFKYDQYSSILCKQCSGSVTFWYGFGSVPLTNGSGWRSGSRSCSFCHSDLQDASNKYFFPLSFFAYSFFMVHLNHSSKIKSHKEGTKQ